MTITDLMHCVRWTELDHNNAKNYRLLPRDLPKVDGMSSSQSSYAKDNFAIYRLEARLPFDYVKRPTKRQIILDAADHIDTQQDRILFLTSKLAARDDQVKKMIQMIGTLKENKATLAAEFKSSYTRLDAVKDALIAHKDDKDFEKFYKKIESIMLCGKDVTNGDKKYDKDGDEKKSSEE